MVPAESTNRFLSIAEQFKLMYATLSAETTMTSIEKNVEAFPVCTRSQTIRSSNQRDPNLQAHKYISTLGARLCGPANDELSTTPPSCNPFSHRELAL